MRSTTVSAAMEELLVVGAATSRPRLPIMQLRRHRRTEVWRTVALQL
jgi:hypothetical protein